MAVNSVDVLRQARPEWVPWLAVVDESLREIGGAHWQAVLPASPAARDPAPLLDGAAFALDGAPVRGLFERLLHRASRCGTPKMATLENLRRGALDHAPLLRASIVQDSRAISGIAGMHDIDADALHAVLALLGIPLLQYCRGQWAASLSPGWSAGHCPVCASWPAFAEIRGIDRHRYLRCGRCGAGWHAEVLRCAFCRNADHEQLTTLVPGQQGARGVVEACRRCRSYVKAFTTLQGTPAAAVMLEDLASVELDIAAVEQGFARPAGAACEFDVSVALTPAGGRPFAWNA
jgi:FdhE protein